MDVSMTHLVAAYLVIWIMIGGYMLMLGGKTSALKKRIDLLCEDINEEED